MSPIERVRRWFRRRDDPVVADHELAATFRRIYADGTWTDQLPGMPRSGRGALYERSLSVVQFVEERIADGDVRSIADIGCGDLTYMGRIEPVVAGTVTYTGYDIVPELVEEHRRLGWGRFELGDVTAPGFRVSADLVIVKDVLFHLEDDQVDAALANLSASSWSYLLLTSTDNETNDDRTFDWWHFAPLNLLVPPYSLRPSEALERIDGGHFLVFRREDFTWPT